MSTNTYHFAAEVLPHARLDCNVVYCCLFAAVVDCCVI